MYEQLLSWMCTQENLVDEAETIIRKEMPVRHPTAVPFSVGQERRARIRHPWQTYHAICSFTSAHKSPLRLQTSDCVGVV